MKPKTTLNLFKNFLAIELKKHLLLFLAFAYEKVSPKPSMLFLASILLLNSSITYSQSSSCKATIQVEKNRFTQSVPPREHLIQYKFQIQDHQIQPIL